MTFSFIITEIKVLSKKAQKLKLYKSLCKYQIPTLHYFYSLTQIIIFYSLQNLSIYLYYI